MKLQVLDGDLLDQEVEAIVNPWNRNIIPWWLLLPQGVSGAIKKRGGYAPFKELAGKGGIPLGGAVETCAGSLSFKSIIHVAGISVFWRSSEFSIRTSVRNAIRIANEKNYNSIGFPLIGAGTGGFSSDQALEIMKNELSNITYHGLVKIVRFQKKTVKRLK